MKNKNYNHKAIMSINSVHDEIYYSKYTTWFYRFLISRQLEFYWNPGAINDYFGDYVGDTIAKGIEIASILEAFGNLDSNLE